MSRLYLIDYISFYSTWIDKLQETREEILQGIDQSARQHESYFGLLLLPLLFPIDYEEQDKLATEREKNLYVLDCALAEAKKRLSSPPTFEIALATYSVDASQILWLIEEHFNLEEIKTLAFEIGFDHDNIPGQERSSKARELIMAADRNGKLNLLVAFARKRRPNANWDSCLYTKEF